MSFGVCLLYENYFPPQFAHLFRPKYLCRLARKHEWLQHLWYFVAEINDHESNIISYISRIAPIVILSHLLTPKKFDKCTKWPIVQFQYIL